MNTADFLIDTSAAARVLLGRTATEWDERIAAGLVALCDITELELLYSARGSADRERLERELRTHYAWCPTPDGVFRRARDVQALLTGKGQHRAAGPVDLLVAATAELAGLTLLHHDRDFLTVAGVTGQPERMIDLRL